MPFELSILVAPLQAIVLAVFALAAWRIQLVAQRRFNVAEESILAFSLAKNALDHARNGLAWQGEGVSREQEPNEPPPLTKSRNMYYAPIERLNAAHPKFAEMERVMLLARHHLGEPAFDAFAALLECRHKVIVSAAHLIRFAGQDDWNASDEGRKLNERFRADVGMLPDENNELTQKIRSAESTLRDMCEREAKATAALWPFRYRAQSKN